MGQALTPQAEHSFVEFAHFLSNDLISLFINNLEIVKPPHTESWLLFSSVNTAELLQFLWG